MIKHVGFGVNGFPIFNPFDRTKPRIVTSHIFPPIPVRDFDWCAHYDGEEEAGNYGYGHTEAEAIQDFIDNHQADHDGRLGISTEPT